MALLSQHLQFVRQRRCSVLSERGHGQKLNQLRVLLLHSNAEKKKMSFRSFDVVFFLMLCSLSSSSGTVKTLNAIHVRVYTHLFLLSEYIYYRSNSISVKKKTAYYVVVGGGKDTLPLYLPIQFFLPFAMMHLGHRVFAPAYYSRLFSF